MRELISNASDALEKLRRKQLTEKEVFDENLELEINVQPMILPNKSPFKFSESVCLRKTDRKPRHHRPFGFEGIHGSSQG